MYSLAKLAVVGLVVIGIGALQFAVPALKGHQLHVKEIKSLTSNNNLGRPLANHAVDGVQTAQSGTLYFTAEPNGDKNEVTQQQISPLLQSTINIRITGIVARISLTQTFTNASNHWVNGLYVFPLPENAAVDHLMMTIGERKIEGQIKPKAEAKKIYQQAKIAGNKASLVTQQRPNIFSNEIANIGPNETIKISLEYQQRLSFDHQQYSLRFPMTITPRYSPLQQVELSEGLQPNHQPELHLDNIELSVNLHAGFDIQQIESEFHAIETQQLSDGSYQIKLADQTMANQDFVLNWQPELGADVQTTHFSQLVNGAEYGLITLLPPNLNQNYKAPDRDIIFVIDTSGSMEGHSIQQAKQALLLALSQLKPTDTFNIVEFNSYAQNLWRRPKIANLAHLQDAEYFIQGLVANGGTEMTNAFNVAFSQAHSSRPNTLTQIIFLTDGSVTNEDSLMQLIESNLADTRLFTVGIGSAPNSYFMTEAAKAGRGSYTYIGSVEQVQEKMLDLLTKLQHPAITDIALQIDNLNLQTDYQLEFYPNIINDLYLGEPLVLSYRLSADELTATQSEQYLSKLTLSAQKAGKPWQSNLILKAQTKQSGLNVLWAREKIAQLSRDKRRAHLSQNHTESELDQYQAQITKTAMTHHIVSQYTSLIAVDVTPSRPRNSQAIDKSVANHLPKGLINARSTSLGSLPQTATEAHLKIILGLVLIGFTLCIHLASRTRP